MNKPWTTTRIATLLLLLVMVVTVAARSESSDNQRRGLQGATPSPTDSAMPSANPSAVPSSKPSVNPTTVGPTKDETQLVAEPGTVVPVGPPPPPPPPPPTPFESFVDFLVDLIFVIIGLEKRAGNRPAGYKPITDIFRLKLHWEDFYCWQGNCDESFYCMECVTCDEISAEDNNLEDPPFNCRTPPGRKCSRNDQLWARRCDDGYGALFQVDDAYDDGVLLQIHESFTAAGEGPYCMERTEERFITLQNCNSGQQRQKFQFFNSDEPFELKFMYVPITVIGFGNNYCVTQSHHPKSKEVFGLKDCSPGGDNEDTYLWDAFGAIAVNDPAPGEAGTLSVLGDDGKPSWLYPLQRCQGDCDSAEECAEGLVCLQRDDGDEFMPPGCTGNLFEDNDYCIDPEDIPLASRADIIQENAAFVPDDNP